MAIDDDWNGDDEGGQEDEAGLNCCARNVVGPVFALDFESIIEKTTHVDHVVVGALFSVWNMNSNNVGDLKPNVGHSVDDKVKDEHENEGDDDASK